MRINSRFEQLSPQYVFTEVINRCRDYQQSHPDVQLLRLGVGDVRGPLVPKVIEAMHRAVNEQADVATFHGYGLEEGPTSLRKTIIETIYQPLGIDLSLSEVFISDGAGSDLGNLSDILSDQCVVGIPNPSYPCYLDASVIAGRQIISLPCNESTGFVPLPPQTHLDIIYLCSPGNPIGIAMTREQMTAWVNYALQHHSLIIFDAAYQDYIQSPDIPRSIYEMDGARQVAIEVCSFSKKAAFTGIRCGYTVVPEALLGTDDEGNTVSLNRLWHRRTCAKYNGTSYISTCGAKAALSPEGLTQTRAQIAVYMDNARIIRQQLQQMGLPAFGGVDGPYIWTPCPAGYTSWQWFDYLLDTCHVVCTPGVGFGSQGEGFVRFSAFGDPIVIREALDRLAAIGSGTHTDE